MTKLELNEYRRCRGCNMAFKPEEITEMIKHGSDIASHPSGKHNEFIVVYSVDEIPKDRPGAHCINCGGVPESNHYPNCSEYKNEN